MLGTKGFLNRNTYLPKVLRNGEIASKRTLILVALGKQTKVDLASPPSSRYRFSWPVCLSGVGVLVLKGNDFFAFQRPELVVS